ncbi:MAG: nucleoside recognition domain-containing protein [Bacteroidales bacterium]|nr:nucleoside recognition domain-containing protein [Bacteroidales bacterium]
MTHIQIFTRSLKIILPKALRLGWFLLRMILPISLAVRLLDYFGILEFLAQYLSPIFQYIGLSGNTAIVFLTSMFLPLYAPIAILTSMAITMREATILALMCLVSHNLLVETSIQRSTGSSFAKMLVIRILMSFVFAFTLNALMPHDGFGKWMVADSLSKANSIAEIIQMWFFSSVKLSLLIIGIITVLMFIQRLLLEYKLLEPFAKSLSPLMRVFGLSETAGFSWIVGNVVGLSYGGAIMIEEVKEGRLSKKDSDLLNHHLAINHSMVEDNLLFIALGISAWWIIVPRLIYAIIVVWTQRIFLLLRQRFS